LVISAPLLKLLRLISWHSLRQISNSFKEFFEDEAAARQEGPGIADAMLQSSVVTETGHWRSFRDAKIDRLFLLNKKGCANATCSTSVYLTFFTRIISV
jgi:hypothetical protein